MVFELALRPVIVISATDTGHSVVMLCHLKVHYLDSMSLELQFPLHE